MRAAGFTSYEQVHVVNVDNGKRVVTYIIPGAADSGIICLNGAAAHHFTVGDKVIIMGYTIVSEDEIADFQPKVVFVDDDNKITETTRYEKHGKMPSALNNTK